MKKLTTTQDVSEEIRNWCFLIRKGVVIKKLIKTLNIGVSRVHNWKDCCYMMTRDYAVRSSCCDRYGCEILINIQKFTEDFAEEYKKHNDIQECYKVCFSKFYNVLLHEFRHAAQHRYIFLRLRKNKKIYDRFIDWLYDKYKDYPDFDDIYPLEKDAYEYQRSKDYKDILDGLDFLDKEMEEFLSKK